MIEGSKTWARELCARHGIPGPVFGGFTDPAEAFAFLDRLEPPYVVKADGLAAGKGVTIAGTRAEAERAIRDSLVARVFGDAGSRVVLEECLTGVEVSAFAMTDGKTVLPLTMAQDYKRAMDGDEGPNTGGMGAYSPLPFVDEAMKRRIDEEDPRPDDRGDGGRGRPIPGRALRGPDDHRRRAQGPRVQRPLGRPRDAGDASQARIELGRAQTLACVEGNLAPYRVTWQPEARVGVVMVSQGYPGAHDSGKEIHGLQDARSLPDVEVYHSGTALRDGRVVTAGGRPHRQRGRPDAGGGARRAPTRRSTGSGSPRGPRTERTSRRRSRGGRCERRPDGRPARGGHPGGHQQPPSSYAAGGSDPGALRRPVRVAGHVAPSQPRQQY